MSQPTEGAGPRRYADLLRHEIDSGRTGDKVAYPDPAAAPLGTDDEAAGHPPSAAAVTRAMADETVHRDSAATTSAEGTLLEGGPAYAMIGAVVIAVLLMLYYVIGHMR